MYSVIFPWALSPMERRVHCVNLHCCFSAFIHLFLYLMPDVLLLSLSFIAQTFLNEVITHSFELLMMQILLGTLSDGHLHQRISEPSILPSKSQFLSALLISYWPSSDCFL